MAASRIVINHTQTRQQFMLTGSTRKLTLKVKFDVRQKHESHLKNVFELVSWVPVSTCTQCCVVRDWH
jgi:hypothetical protein